MVSAGIDIENGGLDRPRDRVFARADDVPRFGRRRPTTPSLSKRPVPLRDARVSATEAPRTRVPIGPDPIANNASTDRGYVRHRARGFFFFAH